MNYQELFLSLSFSLCCGLFSYRFSCGLCLGSFSYGLCLGLSLLCLRLFLGLHLSLQLCQSVEVAQCGAGSLVLNQWSLFLLSGLAGSLLGLASLTSFCALHVFEDAAVREDNALGGAWE